MNYTCPECAAEIVVSSRGGSPPAAVDCWSCGVHLRWDGSGQSFRAVGMAAKSAPKPTVPVRVSAGGNETTPLPADAVPFPSEAGKTAATGPTERIGAADSPLPQSSPQSAASRPSEPAETLVGLTIGGCEIVDWIGRGGMGAVYKARQVSLDRTVAFKVISRAMERDEGFLRRFEREAKTIAKFTSKRIVQVYEVGFAESIHFIVMEYIPGGDLKSKTRRLGRIPHDEALRLTRQAAEGLLEAEKKKIIHRDLKPENLMLDGDGEVKITDFGLARSLQTDFTVTQMGDYLGTPIYMSPEQAQGQQLDHRSDMYSLGATLFYLITGAPPYSGGTIYEILRKKSEFEFLDPRPSLEGQNLPEGVLRILQRMTAKKPDDRYPSFLDLMEDIDRHLRGERPRPLPGIRWKRMAAIAACVVVLLGLGALLVPRTGLTSRERRQPRIPSNGSGAVEPAVPGPPQGPGATTSPSTDPRLAGLQTRLARNPLDPSLIEDAEQLKKDLIAENVDENQPILLDLSVLRQQALAATVEDTARRVAALVEKGKSAVPEPTQLAQAVALRQRITKTPKDSPEVQEKLERSGKDLDGFIRGGLLAIIEDSGRKLDELRADFRTGPTALLPGKARDLRDEIDKRAREIDPVIADAGGAAGDAPGKLNDLRKRVVAFIDLADAGWTLRESLEKAPSIRVAMPFTELTAEVRRLRVMLTPSSGAPEPDLGAWLRAEQTKREGDAETAAEGAFREAVRLAETDWDGFRKGESKAVAEFPPRVEALAAARQVLAEVFPVRIERWNEILPDDRLSVYKSGISSMGSGGKRTEELKAKVTAVEKLFPEPSKAALFDDALAASIGEARDAAARELAEVRESLGKDAPPAVLASLEAEGKRIDGVGQSLERWKAHGKGVTQAIDLFAARRLASFDAALAPLKENGIADPRIEALAAARKSLGDGFRALLESLNIEAARAAFADAAGRCGGPGLEKTLAWPQACARRIEDLRAAVASMAPVPGGSVKVRENEAVRRVGAFFLDCCEVSVGEFRKFLEEQGKSKTFADVSTLWPDERTWQRGRNEPAYLSTLSDVKQRVDGKWPIEEVDYYQALAFCRSRGKDLPAVEEWWVAAKGRLEDGSHRQFPSIRADINSTRVPVPVDEGSICTGFSARQAVHHLSGNVAEWTKAEKGGRQAAVVGGCYRDTDERYFSGERMERSVLTDTRRGYGFRGVLRPKDYFAALLPAE